MKHAANNKNLLNSLDVPKADAVFENLPALLEDSKHTFNILAYRAFDFKRPPGP